MSAIDNTTLSQRAQEFPAYRPRPSAAPVALEGIRVVDFTHFIAGPLATMFLADMGADVVKIEAPERGDELRYYPPAVPGLEAQGGPFLWSNRNKRSVALDLKSPAGIEVALGLIADADVVVENFSTGVMKRLGLGYETCRALNPKLIYCSVSAYGREGPFSDRLGFDPVVQAESGFVSMNGYADRMGVRASAAVMDISTAMMVSNAILGALFSRERQGEGQFVEVALFDTGLLMTGWATMQHLVSGKEPQRHGNTSSDTCPSGVFEASDTSFYINCGNDKIFQRLVGQVLEREDLANDDSLKGRNDRIARREFLFEELGKEFRRQPWLHWQARMRQAQIPCGEVRTVGQAMRSAEAQARNLVTHIPHPDLGQIPNIASPIRYARTPVVDPSPAPAIGQHTSEVLQDVLGWAPEKIAEMARSGAFGMRIPATTGESESPIQ
ncbi:CaiB/BaiF CoA transferase family protein [Candidimonas nitroreducens]|uniref:Carnitine dehydratase n=1 Tax=Candidimonas nitroreducens TaxID=683354 RepID=A0A225MQM3_9BURK|nr:CoA transferase [Candidimonas nitroreducens]OWT63574.1 carnitine dehydratase [Candidimonas nitroreducens]